VSRLLQWARESKVHIVDKWKKAVEVFPPGWAIDGYPGVVGDPTAKRSAQALFIVSSQLKRDGVKVDEVEAVTLFSGDDGLVTCDVILVVRKASKRIVAVYQGWHGRQTCLASQRDLPDCISRIGDVGSLRRVYAIVVVVLVVMGLLIWLMVQRRQFTAEYRRRILKEADACKKHGALGALLRREGLYSSHLRPGGASASRASSWPGARANVDPRPSRSTRG
jgi:hypothetical protein